MESYKSREVNRFFLCIFLCIPNNTGKSIKAQRKMSSRFQSATLVARRGKKLCMDSWELNKTHFD